MRADISPSRAVQLIGRPVFTTREVAGIRGASVATTTQALRRMQRDGLLVRVARGVWLIDNDPRFSPYLLVSILAGTNRAYVSFYSGLRIHGMIEQIPRVIYAATTGHTRLRNTPVATFSFHQVDPRFFAGFDWHGRGQEFLVATREKALVDCLYLSSRKGKRFRHFPEIDLGRHFSVRRARAWVRRINDARIRNYVGRRLAELTC